jgi:hypothetical protein
LDEIRRLARWRQIQDENLQASEVLSTYCSVFLIGTLENIVPIFLNNPPDGSMINRGRARRLTVLPPQSKQMCLTNNPLSEPPVPLSRIDYPELWTIQSEKVLGRRTSSSIDPRGDTHMES